MTSVAEHPVEAGNAAIARSDWPAARSSFEAALDSERRAEAHDGLGWLGWWTSDAELCLTQRELAFRAFRDAGDDARAGHVAAWLAADHLEFRGDDALGRGWMAQARRAAERAPEGSERGWVMLLDGYLHHALDADSDGAIELAEVALHIGREHGVPGLEAVALAQGGLSRIARGEVREGLAHLDAAASLALGNELRDEVASAWALCMMLAACARLGEVSRAEQWCGALRAFAERHHGRHLLGSCRTSYGCVLTTGGDWGEAESELTSAVEDLAATRAGEVSGGLVRLAMLRARQGRTAEARELYERALPGDLATIGLGELALADGDAAAACDAAERVLRRPTGAQLDRLPALELHVRSRAALGELDAAREAQADIEAIAELASTPYISGRAHLTRAELALAAGDAEAARPCAEDAVDCFARASAPFDAARARQALAAALRALGREEAARSEDRAAGDALAALGVVHFSRGGEPAGELTARELEVLSLVSEGLSDAEVAQRLVVSPHTVHRHVANIRTKLRAPSRAAAVAYAARHGLL